jgi:hypothetical protein
MFTHGRADGKDLDPSLAAPICDDCMFTHRHGDVMDLDPSLAAPICDDCILGKRACTNVRKLPEGLSPPTTRRLERVHVDLSGRLAVKSRSGNAYTFEIVDAHTSRGFTYPVPNKSLCFRILVTWQLETEARTGERVGTYIIDNGELKSEEFIKWCASHVLRSSSRCRTSLRSTELPSGFTAPYMAQLGRCVSVAVHHRTSGMSSV